MDTKTSNTRHSEGFVAQSPLPWYRLPFLRGHKTPLGQRERLIEAGEMFGVGMLAASGKGGLQSNNTYVALEPSEILTIDRCVCVISYHPFESLATVLTILGRKL